MDEHRDGGEAGADGGVPAELAFGDGELAGLAAAAPDGDGLDAAGASGGIGERAAWRRRRELGQGYGRREGRWWRWWVRETT